MRQASDALDQRVRLDIPGVRLRGNLFLGEGVEIDDIERIEGRHTSGITAGSAPTQRSTPTQSSHRA